MHVETEAGHTAHAALRACLPGELYYERIERSIRVLVSIVVKCGGVVLRVVVCGVVFVVSGVVVVRVVCLCVRPVSLLTY